MKLQRLAGYGPIAAFVSTVALVVIAIIQQVAVPPNLFEPVAITFLIALFVWTGSLSVTLLDLEWLEHPATSSPWLRVALGATLVAMVMPSALALIVFAIPSSLIAIPWSVLFAGVGIGLLVHNLEARRARLLHGVLPWIGIVAGGLFVYLAVLQFVFMFTPKLVMGFVYGLPVAQLLYLVWAVWMGVHLIRSRSKAPARITSPATATN